MTKIIAVLLTAAGLCAAPALGLDHHGADAAPAPSYQECVAEWTAFFGTDTQYDDATRAIAMDGLSPDERARMETCDQMLDGGRALRGE
ncbi:hypothetical protein [uncultured Maricaulis sp.]|uniref:hypothetical protein n=1 Tax=uncultured Maricaulis sp. TaxID=174710 RepID=UPI0030DB3863|tara:strand:+ start:78860 stop:79126 length:267 start_codon:yes stop_codon:yes gene_type:complete